MQKKHARERRVGLQNNDLVKTPTLQEDMLNKNPRSGKMIGWLSSECIEGCFYGMGVR
jgi:hypothetical protein